MANHSCAKFECVWRNITEQVRRDAAQFWIAQGAVQDIDQANLRADYLLVIVRDAEGHILAVSTAFKDVLVHMGFSLFSVQMFIGKANRRFGLAQRILIEAWKVLNQRFQNGEDQESLGLLVEVASGKAMRLHNQTIWRAYGMEFVYIGKSANGNHRRVWYFEHSRIPI